MTLTTADGIAFETEWTGPEQSDRAVMLLHDWWGVLDYNRVWAERFAAQGYLSLIVDLYDGEHATDTEEAGEMMRSLDQDVADRKLFSALEWLKGGNRKVAVLGWSLGGYQALQATLLDPENIDATVLYYCRLNNDSEALSGIRGPVLGVFAEQERTWPEKMERFAVAMRAAGKDLETCSYDAGHGFANPASSRYDEDVSAQAWAVTVDFLRRALA